ncbi:MAG: primosomal protein N' [Ruminococcus sp.]|nr:primosomal protein N' [Ruminococcus sp.]
MQQEAFDIAFVAVSGASYSFDNEYSYKIPESYSGKIVPGIRVLVPFGKANRRVIGFVTKVGKTVDTSVRIKPLIRPVDEQPLINQEQLELIRYLVDNTFCTYFEAVRTILPAGFKYVYARHYTLVNSKPENDLSAEELEAVEFIKNCRSQRKVDEFLDCTGDDKKKALVMSLIDKGVIEESDGLKRKVGDSELKMLRLSDVFSQKRGGIALTAKQKLVVELLDECGCISEKEACYMTSCTPSLLKRLEDKGVVTFFKAEALRNAIGDSVERTDPDDIILNDEQQNAFEGILKLCDSGKGCGALLHGVTGSGKTSVFVKLIDAMQKRGRSSLLLVPEISLTPQMLKKFKSLFGDCIAVIHSSLTPGQRMDEYKRIMRGDATIVIGTRSAVFAPIKNLGLMILDEEGEHTYKSEQSPRYHARDVAIQRCGFNNCTLLLASATPSLESYYYAKNGRFSLFEINKRYNDAPLPEVGIIDMQSLAEDGNNGILSFELTYRLKETLASKEQAILLLNRRGYNTFVSCRECRKPIECPNCSIALTYHKKNNRLMCHCCGYSMPLPDKCPECGSEKLNMGGSGTQLIEQELMTVFPSARLLRMDADTASSRYDYEEKFAAFERGEYDIMLGTQMIAKGLDFPNVTCVGVISLDKALFAGDFRSYERTFSLITQVVGRGGRGKKAGSAFIQTFVPDHYVLALASKQDYKEFYEQEIALRHALIYPPFCDICVIGFSALMESKVIKATEYFCTLLKDYLAANKDEIKFLRVLGPAPCALERVGGRYRYRIILKCKNNSELRKMIRTLMLGFYSSKEHKEVRIYADINGDIGM